MGLVWILSEESVNERLRCMRPSRFMVVVLFARVTVLGGMLSKQDLRCSGDMKLRMSLAHSSEM